MVDPEDYVDVNIFVYWLGNHPTFGKTAYKWIKKIEEAPRGKYITSILTLYQAIVIIAGLTGKSLKDQELIEETVNSIKSLPGLTITPLTIEDVTQAEKLMREHNLDYEDAIHLATALRNRAKEIISNDEDFEKTTLKRKFS
ncbi:MAG: type II toxin-antitoxin system VapC family toxin [Candidatus Bathyarchaeia archaeon]